MRLIIAGGRDYVLKVRDAKRLDMIENVDEVVSGGDTGTDAGGEKWARVRGKKLTVFPVKREDWEKYGKIAGPMRNRKMARYADAVALFPGGSGTRSMFEEAKIAGIMIFDFRGLGK